MLFFAFQHIHLFYFFAAIYWFYSCGWGFFPPYYLLFTFFVTCFLQLANMLQETSNVRAKNKKTGASKKKEGEGGGCESASVARHLMMWAYVGHAQRPHCYVLRMASITGTVPLARTYTVEYASVWTYVGLLKACSLSAAVVECTQDGFLTNAYIWVSKKLARYQNVQ